MSSGSYHPGPVRAVEIPKKGGTRVLGIPSVVDRVAQAAAATALEPSVEPIFHEDSYGYRPGRAPVDAVAVCRERCFRRDWVVDLDIRAFFDSVPWDLMLRAVVHHTDQKWVVMYVERWLKAPMQRPDGRWSTGSRARRKAARSRLFSPTCFCTMGLMHGWSGSSRPSRLSALQTMR
jgi:RNA-directed DNA polymerase